MRRALVNGFKVAMFQEQDPHKGGVAFRTFFKQTPKDLQNEHHLYATGSCFIAQRSISRTAQRLNAEKRAHE